jgi:protein-disulfide isomerase
MDKSKRQQRLEKKQQAKRQGQMRLVGIVAVVAIGLAALFIFAGQVRVPDVEHSYDDKNGTLLGNPSAPVLVVEYGDFQCSHCRNFYATTEAQLISTYVETGDVLYEYRPVDFLGPESSLSAEAALCAADQNFFWEFHDILFTNYSTGNSGGYSEVRLTEFAGALDMDQDEFSACLSSGEKASTVQTIRTDAAAFGVTGTPSFLINGQLLGGNVPFGTLSETIDSYLGG